MQNEDLIIKNRTKKIINFSFQQCKKILLQFFLNAKTVK